METLSLDKEMAALLVIGLIAHTCVESTVRCAAELGYEVTVVKDATADYSDRDVRSHADGNGTSI